MQDIRKTRFIAANYSNLQGLKAVPVGLLLLVLVIWANAQTGRASDLTLPILFALGVAVVTGAIYRYYRVYFGRTERKPWQKRIEWVLQIAGGVIALAAFVVDTSLRLPVSMVGLVFTAEIVIEYLRMQWYAPGRYMLPITVIGAGIMLLVSILPVVGGGEWWRLLGMRAQLFGVLAVAGVIIALNGLFEHWFFVRQLPKAER